MAVRVPQDTSYGLSQALIGVTPSPIVSPRDPTSHDRAQLGQAWINRTSGTCFFLTRIAGTTNTWYAAAAAAAAYTAAGLVTGGTGLLATSGAGNTTGTGLQVDADGADITGSVNITGGIIAGGGANITGNILGGGSIQATTTTTVGTALTVGTTAVIGTGLTVTAGGTTISAGGIAVAGNTLIAGTTNINTANALATNIGRGGTGTLALGNVSAGSTLHGQDVTVKLGDNAGARKLYVHDSADAEVASLDSNGVLTLVDDAVVGGDATITGAAQAASYVIGAAGPQILAGAGDPVAVVPQGSLYVKTDAAGTTDRLWITTDGAGTWTYFTAHA